MPRTPQPPRQSTDIRQASLIEAALRLAAQRSPADITTGDLAAAVGISQGAVFRHFSSKDAIWIAVLDWVSANLMERLHVAAQARNSDPTVSHPLAALQDVFIAHVDFVMCPPGCAPHCFSGTAARTRHAPQGGSARPDAAVPGPGHGLAAKRTSAEPAGTGHRPALLRPCCFWAQCRVW